MGNTADRLTGVVSVRFTESEMEVLRSLAEGRPISHVVRELCMRAAGSGKSAQLDEFLVTTCHSEEAAPLMTFSINTDTWSAPALPMWAVQAPPNLTQSF